MQGIRAHLSGIPGFPCLHLVRALGACIHPPRRLFSQRLPFFDSEDAVRSAHSIEEISAAVSSAPIAYDWGPWQGMSPLGVDFVRGCLARGEAERFSADEALAHPWLAQRFEERDLVVAR